MKERLLEFDILKGLLIICVVVGHTPLNPIGFFDVYWFHMPAFFMISGYFYRRQPDVCFMDKFKKLTLRYVLPYLVFSFALFFIFQTEPFLKFTARVIYGGLINVTEFSYPFWFINALFISLLVLSATDKIKLLILSVIMICLALMVHLPYYYNSIPAMPYGIELAAGAIVYIFIGLCLHRFKYKTFFIEYVIVTIFLASVAFGMFDYKLDMAGKTYNNLFVDYVVPIAFFLVLLDFSRCISRIPVMSRILIIIGESCFKIFFLHAAILLILSKYNFSYLLQIAVCIILGISIHKILQTNRYSKFLFLGQQYNYVTK